TNPDGSHRSFQQSGAEWRDDERVEPRAYGFGAGLQGHNPVMPLGLVSGYGESSEPPGNGLDWRESRRQENDGIRFLDYRGELDDGGFAGGDTNFEGWIIVENGVLQATYMEYDSPVTQRFAGPNNTSIQVGNVSSLHTNREPDGTYRTDV